MMFGRGFIFGLLLLAYLYVEALEPHTAAERMDSVHLNLTSR